MIKEKVLATLRSLGFIPEQIEDFGYRIEYEGLTIIYTSEDDDAKCISMAVPGLFDITDENRSNVIESMVELCGRMKFVQPLIMFDNQVWLCYQHHLGPNEVTTDLVEHMIRTLTISTVTLHEIINGEGNDD